MAPPAATASDTRNERGDVRDPRGELVGLISRVEEVVAGIRPDEVLARHAPQLWDLCDRGAKLFAGAQVLLARRVEDAGIHKQTGAKTTAEYLALRSGLTRAAASDMVATSTHLRSLPSTEAAVRAGQLSAGQAHRVADAAVRNPGEEDRLLGLAKTVSLKELGDEALRVKAAADPDPEATRRRQRRERYFRQGTRPDGAWWFSGRGTPEDAGRFNAALNPLLENIYRLARSQGRHEPRDAYAYDALQQLAHHAHNGAAGRHRPAPGPGNPPEPPTAEPPDPTPPTGPTPPSGPGATPPTGPGPADGAETTPPTGTGPADGIVPSAEPESEPTPDGPPRKPAEPRRTTSLSLLPVLRLDLAALRRGRVETGELCEITGIGPITTTAARELLDHSIIKLVLTRHGDVVCVTHIGPSPTSPTHLALVHLDLTTIADLAGHDSAIGDDRATYDSATGDETCTLPALGTVPAGAARGLLGDLAGHDLLTHILTRGRDVAHLIHPGRQPTVAQRVALLWAQPTCSVAGCPSTFTQIDHRHDWQKNQETQLANLDRLCGHHHRLKSHHNYQLTAGTGNRPFVAPTDPRHPEHRQPSTRTRRAPPQAA
jgi:hypothetical protein